MKNLTRNQKIIIGVVGGIVLLCCIGGGVLWWAGSTLVNQVAQGFNQDPAQAREVGQSIASYTAPSGYTEKFSMELLGIKMVAIGPEGTGNGTIMMLMTFPAGSGGSTEQMQEQMSQAFSQQTGQGGFEFTTSEERTVTIRGQEVAFVIRDGSNSNGDQMRQGIAAFDGDGGNIVMFMAMGEPTSWDEAAIEEFLASIK